MTTPPALDPSADEVARALQDMMALLAPHWGTQAKTWDELGEGEPGGLWCQHLLRNVVSELIRAGVIAPVSRDVLAHLSRDWDAQAASLERNRRSGPLSGELRQERAEVLRQCAQQLRDRLG